MEWDEIMDNVIELWLDVSMEEVKANQKTPAFVHVSPRGEHHLTAQAPCSIIRSMSTAADLSFEQYHAMRVAIRFGAIHPTPSNLSAPGLYDARPSTIATLVTKGFLAYTDRLPNSAEPTEAGRKLVS